MTEVLCNRCSHNEICKFKDQYLDLSAKMEELLTLQGFDVHSHFALNCTCRHFENKRPIIKGEIL